MNQIAYSLKRCVIGLLAIVGGIVPVQWAAAQSVDPYNAGFIRTVVPAKGTLPDIPLVVFYPTAQVAELVEMGPFKLDVAINGEPVEGKHPLVLFSHGSGGSPLNYRSLALDLARLGFVVALPLHPGNNYQDNSAVGTLDNWTNRPRHLRATLDFLLGKKRLAAMIDETHIAVAGHSAGGYSALAMAGAIADTGQIRWLCKQDATVHGPFCNTDKPVLSSRIIHARDARVKALVLMAPVGVLYQTDKALDDVKLPTLLLQAGLDEELIEPHHSGVIVDGFTQPDTLEHRVLKKAGHYAFITPVPGALAKQIGEIALDPEGFDRAALHQMLARDVARWLVDALQLDLVINESIEAEPANPDVALPLTPAAAQQETINRAEVKSSATSSSDSTKRSDDTKSDSANASDNAAMKTEPKQDARVTVVREAAVREAITTAKALSAKADAAATSVTTAEPDAVLVEQNDAPAH